MVVMAPSAILFLFLPPAKTVFFYFVYQCSPFPFIDIFFLFCFSDYSSLQLFLSCGQEVTINSKPVGYRDNGPPVPALPVSKDLTVKSWTNELEDDFFEAQV